MQVTQIVEGMVLPLPKIKVFSEQELEQEYEYLMAQNILKKMLENGLITVDEFNKIMKLNQQSFSPNLVDIMP